MHHRITLHTPKVDESRQYQNPAAASSCTAWNQSIQTRPIMTRLSIFFVFAVAVATAAQTTGPTTRPATKRSLPERPYPAIHGVMIISVDGLRPDLLLRA